MGFEGGAENQLPLDSKISSSPNEMMRLLKDSFSVDVRGEFAVTAKQLIPSLDEAHDFK